MQNNNRARPAIFLDRDGTLNEDKGYVHKVEDWQWLPHAIEALINLQSAGFVLIVVTNQSGIARGFYAERAVINLHNWINEQLEASGCELIFYYCPHHPDISGPCTCRKPLPQMLLQAAAEHHIDLKKSWMIGDKVSDMQAGRAAGCKTLLITAQQQKNNSDYADNCVANLKEALQIICP